MIPIPAKQPISEQTRTSFEQGSQNTLDVNHTHFLLFDDGRLDCHINDTSRSEFVEAMCTVKKCYPVTIIVNGGVSTLKIIFNDLQNSRPVVIVAGSGRLSNVIGDIFETTDDSTIIG